MQREIENWLGRETYMPKYIAGIVAANELAPPFAPTGLDEMDFIVREKSGWNPPCFRAISELVSGKAARFHRSVPCLAEHVRDVVTSIPTVDRRPFFWVSFEKCRCFDRVGCLKWQVRPNVVLEGVECTKSAYQTCIHKMWPSDRGC